MTPLRILLVEDEPALLLTLAEALREAGHEVIRSASGSEAEALLRDARFDMLVTDIRLPGVDGCVLADAALRASPPVAVVLMTAYGQVQQAVAMMKRGVLDYLTKPVNEEELVRIVGRVALSRRIAVGARGDDPVAQSPTMLEVLRVARQVAGSNASLLLTGETGTGKEVVARYVHRVSARSGAAFVGANCASIPRDLLEAELFGHTRGAFTGARDVRVGWVRSANHGTLLLDEVGELTPSAQATLLRVLEERAVQPVGADRPVPVDFRLIGATNRDLDRDQREGRFRSDLYYRLAGFEIRLPPLRERIEDIPLLAARFLAGLPAGTAPTGLSDEALAVLAAYPWPGNVRELRNTIEHAAILTGAGEIRTAHLPARVRTAVPASEPFALRHVIERVEAEHIRRALAIAGGARQRAADLLGISRKHLWELMKRYSIEVDG